MTGENDDVRTAVDALSAASGIFAGLVAGVIGLWEHDLRLAGMGVMCFGGFMLYVSERAKR